MSEPGSTPSRTYLPTSEPRPGRPTEDEIHRLVHAFYARVREDPLLAPVFERRIGGRWDAHLERMVDFWSSVLLASGRYLGNPLEKHRTISGIGSEHFDRWLELFHEVAHEVLADNVAADVHTRASRMREVLERHAVTFQGPGSLG